MKKLYVLENENGLVKIGVSKNVEGRAKVLSHQGGFKIKNLYSTELCSNHFNIEHIIHSNLSNYRKKGEWFEMSFDDAVTIVNKYYNQYAKNEEIVTNYSDMADKFWDIVSQLE